ncbi:acyl carrier protein, partial [Streptomyces ipomoeae]|uniref:acyl carrier protein n=1 Tax=Streptomyces ipomoeae TaxID=103232 RepID=UPI0029B46A5D
MSARLCHHISAVTGHPPTRVTPATALAELGLDSLMAVRIRTAVERDFGIELPLRDLLGAATVEEAAARVRRTVTTGPTPSDGAVPARPAQATSDDTPPQAQPTPPDRISPLH